ncbi:uncharacterized protein BDZ99DRAFT_575483 [Mytilinidion resinicola]|uniref:Uncharacterized protein n=1 Tax=Mytilinidion resinicola TaxID=574789 RepID=A0A6A6Y7K6_9PEZI|nr:uncharacterized protein BDZ99DRAFT_575483 [Mytilinidion resinicola]KAF2804165.1 hypothetical protein BDZ99DRAFT_575483 [Mytilinidion resinicola]
MLESQRQALRAAKDSLQDCPSVRSIITNRKMWAALAICLVLVGVGVLIAYLVKPQGLSEKLD